MSKFVTLHEKNVCTIILTDISRRCTVKPFNDLFSMSYKQNISWNANEIFKQHASDLVINTLT